MKTCVSETYTPVEDEGVDECACLCKITVPEETKWIYVGKVPPEQSCAGWCSTMHKYDEANELKTLLKNGI